MGYAALIVAFVAIYLIYRRFQTRRDVERVERSRQFKARVDAMDKEWKQERAQALRTDKGEGKRPNDWKIRRQIVLDRDGHRCVQCGAMTNLHVHHIVKRSKTIDHSTQNLITLCVHCHAKADGHGAGLVSTQAAWIAHRKGYERRKGRKTYVCAKCSCEIAKGEISFPRKAEYSHGLWFMVKERMCEKCILNS